MSTDFLASAYKTRDEDRAIFGSNWCGPERFEYGEPTLVARYTPRDGSDGVPAEVWCGAMPARFYEVHVLSGKNSLGEEQPAWPIYLTTGSGREMAKLSHEIALAAAEGMLGSKLVPSAGETP